MTLMTSKMVMKYTMQKMVFMAFTQPITKIVFAASFLKFYIAAAAIWVTFFGTGLGYNKNKDEFTGEATGIKISEKKDGSKPVDVTLPESVKLDDLDNAADSAPGMKGTPIDTMGLDMVLSPPGTPFPNMEFTGNRTRDVVRGYDMDDMIVTRGGNDAMFMSGGNDTFKAGAGRDTFDASFWARAVEIDLAAGTAKSGKAKVKLSNVENAIGTNKNDTIGGDDANNRLEGNGGADNIKGLRGNDTLEGGRGDDTINGGDGRDTVEGGKGDDVLRGGGKDMDRDTFRFSDKNGANNGTDRIKDWETGIDRIHIEGGRRSEVDVKVKNGNTIINYDEGKIIIENKELMKGDIDFIFH